MNEIADRLLKGAHGPFDANIVGGYLMGAYGAALLPDGAGALATAGNGMALGVNRSAVEADKTWAFLHGA